MSNSAEDSGGAIDISDVLVDAHNPETFADPRDADLLNKSRAEAAYDEDGLAGAVEVSQDILRDTIDDLSTLAERGDVRASDVQFHVSTLREIDDMLSTATRKELHSDPVDERPSVGEPQPTTTEVETEAEPSENHTDSDHPADNCGVDRDRLIEATIDRISGSGNILAISPDLSTEHIHVTHGTIGDRVVVLKPADGWERVKTGKARARVLPYSEIEDATEALSTDEKLQLKPGNCN